MKQGVIINIGYHNIGKNKPFPNITPYAIAKNGILIYSMTLSQILKQQKKKIRVNIISPGFMVNSKIRIKPIKQIGKKKPYIEHRKIIETIKKIINNENLNNKNIIIEN